MSLGVLNNLAATYAQNSLNQTQSSLQKTLQQLSSGSRINSGSDDAAGLAVVDGLQANEAALTQSSQNASDGVGLLQTADGALAQVTNLLDRAVTLATESANGTLNSSQVTAANQEYQNILSQISTIGSTTNFNSNTLFTSTATNLFVSDGTTSGTTTYADVIGALSKASVGVSSVTNSAAATATAAFSTPSSSSSSAASTSSTTLVHATDTLSGSLTVQVGSGATNTYTIAAGTTGTQLAAQINATTSSTNVSATFNSTTGVFSVSGPVAASSTLTIGGTVTDATAATQTLGAGVDFSSDSISTLTQSSASSVLTSVTAAIADVALQRGVIGADVNTLNAASNVASNESENLSAAEDTLNATNYGQATSDLAKYQVLSQTGISALAQANSVQQEVLKLLQ